MARRERGEERPVPAPGVAPGPADGTPLARAHERFGWTALFVWLAFGTILEGLLGWKEPAYLLDPLRRELWTLAHFHGAMLALANLLYAPRAAAPVAAARRRGSWALRAGALLLPAGFLFGGMWHPESDPGAGILLVPAGALLVLYAVAVQAMAAWRRPRQE